MDFRKVNEKPVISLQGKNIRMVRAHKSQFSGMKNIYAYSSLDDECMSCLYNLSDIVVMPSKLCKDGSSDRSPNSLIEATTCGKAIVEIKAGGSRQ